MKLFVVLALCAVALSRRVPKREWIDEIVDERFVEDDTPQWTTNKEFRYIYEGQITSVIPGTSKQAAASRIQAVVSFETKEPSYILFQMTHIRMGRLNRVLPSPRAMVPFEAYDQVEIAPEMKEVLLLPVKFVYDKGLIREIEFDSEEQPWSANIKRGVLNMVQLNLEKHRRTDLAEEARMNSDIEEPSRIEKFDYFTAMEETIEGDCETFYTITSEPTDYWRNYGTPVFNVTKSINFEKCNRRPEVTYNHRFSSYCPSCERLYEEQEKYLESSSVARFNLTGTPERHVIQSARIESQYTYTPYSEQGNVIITYVNQTLELVRLGKATRNIPTPRNPEKSDTQMLYTLDWDIEKEEFYMKGESKFQETSPYSTVENPLTLVSGVIKTLVHSMHRSSENVPRYFARLVQALRYCRYQDLEKLFQKYFKSTPENYTPEEHKQIKDLLIDALGAASTRNTVRLLMKEIRNKNIPALKAAFAIKAIINAPVASWEMIDDLLKLSESEVAIMKPVLKQSALLTAGSLIGALCKPNEDKIAKEYYETPQNLCPKSLKEKYVQIAEEKFNSAKNVYEKILVLKMVANAGLDLSVYPLEKIIYSSQYPVIVRQQAIEALRKLRDVMPRKVQSILMPIYMNQHQLPELRMLAFSQIMQTIPPRPVLDQITEKMFTERSKHVAGFVYTYLTSLSYSNNPCEKRLAQDIQLSLRQGRRVPSFLLPLLSRYYHAGLYSQEYKTGFDVDMGVLKTNTSFLPKDVAFSLHTVKAGFWNRYFATVGVMQTNTEDLITSVLSKVRNGRVEELLRRSPRDTRISPQKLLRKIYTEMKFQERRYINDEMAPPMALLYLRFKDEDFGLLPISYQNMPESIKELVSQGDLDISAIERFLSSGYHFNRHVGILSNEYSKKIPTTVGMPLQIYVKAPIVLSFIGKVKGRIHPEEVVRKVDFQLAAEMYATTNYQTEMQVWSPVINSGVKVVAEARVHLPVDVRVSYDTEMVPASLKVVLITPPKTVKLLSVHTRPITFTKVWPQIFKTWLEPEEKTIYGEQWDRVNTDVTEFGSLATGYKFVVRRQWHRTPIMHLISTPVCPLSGPNRFEILVEPGYQQPEKILFEIRGTLSKVLEKELHSPVLIKNLYKNSKAFFGSEEESLFDSDEEEYNYQYEDEKTDDLFNEYINNYETEKPEESRLKVLVVATGEIKREMELTLTETCDVLGRHCQFKTLFKRTPIPQIERTPWKMEVLAEILYPETPYTLNELRGKKMVKTVKAEWGNLDYDTQFVHINVEGERSRQQEYLRQQGYYTNLMANQDTRYKFREIFSPVSQYENVLKASTLTQFKIKANYKLSTEAKNVTNSVYRMLKYLFYFNTDVAQFEVENPEGQILAKVNICPKTFKYVNVTAKLPYENVTMMDIPFPMPLYTYNIRTRQPFQLKRLIPGLTNSYYGQMPVCKVQSNKIRTFDKVIYRVPLTTCYSVISKDCSSENPKFAVMLKKLSETSSQKKLRVITEETVIEVYPEMDMIEEYADEYEKQNLKVVVNGEEREIERYQTISPNDVEIKRDGPQIAIRLLDPAVKVYFDGYTVSVKVSPSYQNLHCGLCGDYDSEQVGEFALPNGEIAENMQEFHRSYLNEDSCELNEEWLNDKDAYEYSPMKYERYDDLYDEDEYDEDYEPYYEELSNEYEEDDLRENSGYEPIMTTKITEIGHEICFSKIPVPRCPKHTYATETLNEKKVTYGCVSRYSSEATKLQNRLFRNKYYKLTETELESLPQSFTEMEVLPKRCIPL